MKTKKSKTALILHIITVSLLIVFSAFFTYCIIDITKGLSNPDNVGEGIGLALVIVIIYSLGAIAYLALFIISAISTTLEYSNSKNIEEEFKSKNRNRRILYLITTILIPIIYFIFVLMINIIGK